MKGKTNQPLRIWVWHPWVGKPWVAKLHDQGHMLAAIGSEGGLCDIAGAEPLTKAPDLILHPAAHGWNDEMETYLPAALREARRRKKGAKCGT